jgi:hypothetical protein
VQTRNRGAGDPPADDRAALLLLIGSIRTLIVSVLERPALLGPHAERFREASQTVAPVVGAVKRRRSAQPEAEGVSA